MDVYIVKSRDTSAFLGRVRAVSPEEAVWAVLNDCVGQPVPASAHILERGSSCARLNHLVMQMEGEPQRDSATGLAYAELAVPEVATV